MPPTPIVRQNGLAIRAFREIRGLSVNELAQRVGVSGSALRNWELENKSLPRTSANRLATELNVDLGAFLRDPITEAATVTQPAEVA